MDKLSADDSVEALRFRTPRPPTPGHLPHGPDFFRTPSFVGTPPCAGRAGLRPLRAGVAAPDGPGTITEKILAMSQHTATCPCAHEIQWNQADYTVYAATRNGEFAGYITTSDTECTLYGELGQVIGVYPDLDAAQEALDRK